MADPPLPSVHDDHARVSFIAFRYTNNTVSDYFRLKTDLLFEETKSGKALASLVAPSPTPLGFRKVGHISRNTTLKYSSHCSSLMPDCMDARFTA